MLVARYSALRCSFVFSSQHLIRVLHLIFEPAISKAIGADIALLSVLCAFPLVMLISALPFSFAGWGLREGAMVVVFASLGVPKETSLVISIVFGVSLFLSSLVGVGLWLTRTQEANSFKSDLSGSNRV